MNKIMSCLLLLATPFAGHATESLPPMLVTATGYPIPVGDTLASVEIITAEEIANTPARDLGDLLKFRTGLELSRNGGPGQASSLFIRGTESDHNIVMINGVPINSGSVGGAALQHIDPQLIARIEIVKGPQSTLWGSGAIGGVINIITLDQGTGHGGYGGSLEGGGDDTLRGSAYVSRAEDNWQASASLSHHQTDGFPTTVYSDENRGYTNTSINFGGGFNVRDNKFNLSHWQTEGNNEYVDFFLLPVDQDFLNSSSILSWNIPIQEWWQSDLQISYVRDDIEQNQSDEEVETDRTALEWRNDFRINPDQRFALGLVFTGEEVTAVGGFSPYETDTRYREAYGQYDAYFGDHHLIAGLRHLDHDDAGTHLTWNLNYGYDLGGDTHLFASAATGFRFPNTNERFGFGGNPELKPEESLSFEVGIRHQLTKHQEIHASIYRNDIDNLIQWVLTAPPFTGYNQNIDETRIDGIEADYSLNHGPWTVVLGGTLQDSRNLSDDSRLLRRARYSMNSRLTYSVDNWDISGDLLHSGDRKDFGGVTLPSYTVVNIGANYQLSPRWTVFTKVENLFDEDYELAEGFNTQERVGYLGIRFR